MPVAVPAVAPIIPPMTPPAPVFGTPVTTLVRASTNLPKAPMQGGVVLLDCAKNFLAWACLWDSLDAFVSSRVPTCLVFRSIGSQLYPLHWLPHRFCKLLITAMINLARDTSPPFTSICNSISPQKTSSGVAVSSTALYQRMKSLSSSLRVL
jgi:hypothetical protein